MTFQNNFAEIAKLLSDFFRDLDVVPSDVVAGLVLLRKFQRMERQDLVNKVRQTLNLSWTVNNIKLNHFCLEIINLLVIFFINCDYLSSFIALTLFIAR